MTNTENKAIFKLRNYSTYYLVIINEGSGKFFKII